MKKASSDIGIIGLGVMGSNLARNIESRGYAVSVYNRSFEKTRSFLSTFDADNFEGHRSLKSFVASLKRPRKVMIMVKAGGPVDAVIKKILPYLQKGDVIIDGGNSFYKDTQRRSAALKKKGIHYLGCGVSGGEDGALHGPSLMPGGSKAGWNAAKRILESIAAKDFSGGPCVTYIGDNGAGHYVKMVHNGIEYAIMQLMAETYALYRLVYEVPAYEISQIFAKYNRGKLNSFLFEIAVPVLAKQDERTGECCLVYKILDKAGSKGTGKWTAIDALDRGVATPSIAGAVYARSVSAEKTERTHIHKLYKHTHGNVHMARSEFEKLLGDALYAAIIGIFAQGFDLIRTAAKEEKWDIDLAEVARIWQGGCIIRAKLLDVLHGAYRGNGPHHLFESKQIATLLKRYMPALRSVVAQTTGTGVSVAGFASSLFYFESMIEHRLPANFIQGLRDYFGAHTYERIDIKGTFHTDWD